MTGTPTDGRDASTDGNPDDATTVDAVPGVDPIEPATPDAFGLVQAWWGDGKGKTTAALGIALRAAGHGYRVHVIQFMKGGTPSVEGVRGEFNAIEHVPGYTIENTGHVGWHGFVDGSEDDEHAARARAALARAREIIEATAERDPTTSFALDGDPTDGVHMLILDEVLYAANRGLIDTEDVVALLDEKPDALEVVLTGGHERPAWIESYVDLLTRVAKEKHPLDAGQGARKGTEF